MTFSSGPRIHHYWGEALDQEGRQVVVLSKVGDRWCFSPRGLFVVVVVNPWRHEAIWSHESLQFLLAMGLYAMITRNSWHCQKFMITVFVGHDYQKLCHEMGYYGDYKPHECHLMTLSHWSNQKWLDYPRMGLENPWDLVGFFVV